MMKKLKSKAGMTLMEVLVSLLIMVLLVVGMGTGMDAGMRVYRDAHFESSSASLAGIINTALGDVLRYSQDVKTPEGDEINAPASAFIFTNLEYGLRDVQFALSGTGMLQLQSTEANSSPSALVNSGAYSGLKIADGSFSIQYYPGTGKITTLDGTGVDIEHGNVFYIRYKLQNSDETKSREVETVVRLMNG